MSAVIAWFRDCLQIAKFPGSAGTSRTTVRYVRRDFGDFSLDTLRRAREVGIQRPRHVKQRAQELPNGAWDDLDDLELNRSFLLSSCSRDIQVSCFVSTGHCQRAQEEICQGKRSGLY